MKKLYILLLCLFNVYFSVAQTYTMPTGTGTNNVSTCSGTFYDSGGAGANYGSDANSTITFCPGTAGQLIRIVFNNYNAENLTDGTTLYDYLEIYNGPSTASPLMTTLATDFTAPITFESSDPSGCLTFHFVSDGSVQQSGWSGTISCFLPCSPPTSNVTATGFPAPPAKICPGTAVNLSGAGSTPAGGFTIANYSWDFGDGSPAGTGVNVNHTFPDVGIYYVNLTVTDNNGCVNSNLTKYEIDVSPPTFFNGSSAADNQICLGESTTITGIPTPQIFQEEPLTFVAGELYLPDGDNAGYNAQITYQEFAPGATVTNVNQILDIWANLEHTYLGDLAIDIICPNGSTVGLHNADHTFDGAQSQSLGNPIPTDGTGPGTGFDYSWPTSGATTTLANAAGNPRPAGSYLSEEAFTALLGCPLNGTWTLYILDTELQDDGYIFNWGINFDPSLYNLQTLTPVNVNSSWAANPSITNTAGNTITVQPATTGTHSYTFTSVNDYGCSFDTTISITVNPLPVANAGTNTTICSGVNSVLGAAAVAGFTYAWNPATNISSATAANPTFNAANAGPGTVTYSYTLTITNTITGCQDTDQVVIGVAPSPTVTVNSPTICAGTTGLLASGADSYTWSTGATPTSPSGDMADVSPVATTQYTVTGTVGSCTATAVSTVTVVNNVGAPTPDPVTYCLNEAAVPLTATADAGGTLNWYGTNATGGTASATAPTPSTTTATTTTYYVSQTLGGCEGPRAPLLVTVTPLPVLSPVASQTVCAESSSTAVNFTSNPAGGTFDWTNSNGTIGIGANGTGNIPAFTGVNGSAISVNGSFSATTTVNGCTSLPQTFTITINPLPVLSPVGSQTVCADAATTALNFVYVPAGSTVNWTNSDGSIGVGTSGSGNISSFNGLNTGLVPVTGNFSATATLNGCTSLPQTFSITIDPTPQLTSVPSETVCAGASTTPVTFSQSPVAATVNWTNNNGTIGLVTGGNGNIASFTGTNTGSTPVAGNFSATATLNGCSSTPQTFTITVNPMPTLAAVSSQSVCAQTSTAAINFAPSPAASTVNWTNSDASIGIGAAGSGNIAPFTGINSSLTAVTGNFSATATLNNCTSLPQTFSVTINPLPVPVASNLGNPYYCVNGTFSLDVNPGGGTAPHSFSWTGPLSYSSTAQSNTVTLISVPMSGDYTVIVTDANTCVGQSTTSVTVNPLPIITASNNGPLCVGENLILSCTPGSSYSWSGPNGYNSTLANPSIPSVTTGDAAMYSVIVTDANGCQGPGFTSVVVNTNPTPVASNNGPVCLRGTLTLSLDQAYDSYSWTGPNGFNSTSASPVINNISNPASGVYNVTVTDGNGCTGTSNTTAAINQLPTATLNSVAPGCAPICRDFYLSSTSALVSYTWSMGNGFVVGNDTVLQHCYQLPATYPVSCHVTDTNGCSDTIHFNPVNVYEVPKPEFTFGPSEVTILEPEVNFTNQSVGNNIVNYAWEFGDPNNSTSGYLNPTFIYGDVGTYNVTLTITNNRGCIDSITHPVTIPEGWAIYVPNAFSPNDDGFNDYFYPKGVGIDEKKFQMWIFDRWGNQLFYTTNWDEPWNGKVAGHENIVQQDTYIWKIIARSFKGDKFNKTGHVHVIR